MKQLAIRVKEIQNPKNKNEVYLVLFSILDDLACYSSYIYDNLIESNYREPKSIEVEDDLFIPYLKKIVRENKCDDIDSLIKTLNEIRQVLVRKGMNHYDFNYDVEETLANGIAVSIAVFA